MINHSESAYVTLDRVVQQLDLIDEAAFTTTTAADARITAQNTNTRNHLKDLIYEVSEDLYNQWHRDFVPRVQTITIYANTSQWRGWCREGGDYVFYLDKIPNADLLEIDSITLDGTSINSAYYRLDNSFGYPSQAIRFDADNVTMPSSRTFSTSLVIEGTWGYHENPSNMWLDSGDTVQDNPLSASATTLNVSDGTNFETYQYIKIEDEILFITAISTNALTVERGVNGSTAAIHVQTTEVYTYNQTPSVSKDVARMVIREYALRNGVNIVTAGEAITDLTVGKFLLKIPTRWTLDSV